MATVLIPALLRELCRGADTVQVPAGTVRQIVAALEARYPGIAARLCPGGDLDPWIMVVIDGAAAALGLEARAGDGSEVLFLPAIAGG